MIHDIEMSHERDIINAMSALAQKVPIEFKSLSSEAQIKYVQNLWDFIVERSEEISVPEAHKRVLDNRLVACENDEGQAVSWKQSRDAILKNLEDL